MARNLILLVVILTAGVFAVSTALAGQKEYEDVIGRVKAFDALATDRSSEKFHKSIDSLAYLTSGFIVEAWVRDGIVIADDQNWVQKTLRDSALIFGRVDQNEPNEQEIGWFVEYASGYVLQGAAAAKYPAPRDLGPNATVEETQEALRIQTLRFDAVSKAFDQANGLKGTPIVTAPVAAILTPVSKVPPTNVISAITKNRWTADSLIVSGTLTNTSTVGVLVTGIDAKGFNQDQKMVTEGSDFTIVHNDLAPGEAVNFKVALKDGTKQVKFVKVLPSWSP